jgi:tight adherence protein C
VTSWAILLEITPWWQWVVLALTSGGALTLLVLGYLDTRKEERLDTIAQRVEQLTGHVPEARTKAVKATRQKTLQKPLTERMLFPLAQKTADLLQGFLPMGARSWTQTKLQQAGYNQPRHAKLFLGFQLLFATTLFGFFMLFTLTMGKVSGVLGVVVSLIFGMVGYGLPLMWLIQQVQNRQKAIQRGVSDFLDLLVICVEAGLGLDVAMAKIAELPVASTSGHLKAELHRYGRDISLGKPRRESLQGLATRTGVDDLNTMVNALIQAYEMGTGVTQTLRVQSDMLRAKRLLRAEEQANKIPVKMVIPIYIFLFPAIFVAMFGPLGMTLVKAMGNILGNMDSLN